VVFFWAFVYPLATLRAMKDVGLRIRVQRDLRDAFLAACRSQDKPAAQVLREFMRAYVDEHPVTEAESKLEPKPTDQ
jgi:lipase chaperone LimK